MILISDDKKERYVEAGLWGTSADTHTLDGLLRNNARILPDQTAVADDPNKASWTSGKARHFTWSELNHEVEKLASFLQKLDLATDTVIALYGPNTSDMIISFFAIHRIGCIAAPIPVFWRETEMQEFLMEVQARVIITVDRLEDDCLALRCRNLSQRLFSIKYILGFGKDLPDGVVDLQMANDLALEDDHNEKPFKPGHPDAIITIHPTGLQSSDTEVALPRSSNQWLAAQEGLFQTGDQSTTILSPFALSGIIGFCAGLVRSLKQCGSLYLHHFQTTALMTDVINSLKPDLVFLPQGLVSQCLESVTGNHPICVGSIWKNDHLTNTPYQKSGNHLKLLDITVLNEVVAVSSIRDGESNQPAALPFSDKLQNVSLNLRSASDSNLKQPKQLAGGELMAVGAGVPEALFPSNNERRALRRLRNKKTSTGTCTLIACRLLSENKNTFEPIGFLVNTITRFDQLIAAPDLDGLYKSIEGIIDAAHFIDPLTKTLNVAIVTNDDTSLSHDEFCNALSKIGVTRGKVPNAVFSVDEVKRGIGGVTLSAELLKLTRVPPSSPVMEEFKETA